MSGLLKSGDGPLPRPTFTVGNADGFISNQMRLYNDFIGARVYRYRTFGKYLDNGSTPDSTAKITDIYYVNQKKSEDSLVVAFELASAIDIMDQKLPNRPMIADTCMWGYKSSECSWPGTNPNRYYDVDDEPVVSQGDDVCGKRLNSCKLRFGTSVSLPFGAFPALGRG